MEENAFTHRMGAVSDSMSMEGAAEWRRSRKRTEDSAGLSQVPVEDDTFFSGR